MIAEYHGLSPEQVIVTNGATEAIYLVAQAFDTCAVIPGTTFSEYKDACRMFNRPVVDEERVESMLWLCNPNNPTGKVYDPSFIDLMTEKYKLVVIDQSYEQYTDHHVMSPEEGTRIPNLLQIHSFTKTYAVPGLRLGYITAHPCLTQVIRHYLRPWSVSALAVEAGKFLLQHDELIVKPDLQEARRLSAMLQQIPEVSVLPSQTHFMLCRLYQGHAGTLKAYLAEQCRMLIRDASNFDGLTESHFRVAAQSPSENDALAKAIRDYCANPSNPPCR